MTPSPRAPLFRSLPPWLPAALALAAALLALMLVGMFLWTQQQATQLALLRHEAELAAVHHRSLATELAAERAVTQSTLASLRATTERLQPGSAAAPASAPAVLMLVPTAVAASPGGPVVCVAWVPGGSSGTLALVGAASGPAGDATYELWLADQPVPGARWPLGALATPVSFDSRVPLPPPAAAAFTLRGPAGAPPFAPRLTP